MMRDSYDIAFSWYESLFRSSGAVVGSAFLDDCGIGAEVLSLKNKRTGEGREQYLSKRSKLLSSNAHLVEIDLLRGGEPMPMRSG